MMHTCRNHLKLNPIPYLFKIFNKLFFQIYSKSLINFSFRSIQNLKWPQCKHWFDWTNSIVNNSYINCLADINYTHTLCGLHYLPAEHSLCISSHSRLFNWLCLFPFGLKRKRFGLDNSATHPGCCIECSRSINNPHTNTRSVAQIIQKPAWKFSRNAAGAASNSRTPIIKSQ